MTAQSPLQWLWACKRQTILNLAVLLIAALSVVSPPASLASAAQTALEPASETRNALVVYTQNEKVPYGQAGRLYAILLRNLLGHFPIEVAISPLESTATGLVASADAVFFIGFIEGKPLPADFLRTMNQRTRPTVWLGHGIDQAIRAEDGGRRGIAYVGTRSFDKPVPADGENPGFYDTVEYKNLKFVKYYRYDAVARQALADPEVVLVRIADRKRASAIADIANSRSGARAPFVTRSGNFWFVADLPFTYVGPRDRYLVLADLLFDMLVIKSPEDSHRALVRLEDVHPLTRPYAIDRLSEYFHKKRVPFSIAVIPIYRDPYGRAGRNVKEAALEDVRTIPLVEALKRAVARGGSIVQHGTTHQFERMRNPNWAISGDDFEFWDAANLRPIEKLQSETEVRERMIKGRFMLEQLGLKPFAFEMPHYQGSPLSYRVAATLYPATYQRVTYYSNDEGKFGSLAPAGAWSGQEFPFVIRRDYYGQLVLPENLGNLQYSAPVQSVPDLLLNADYAKVVRGGFASFFFHPFFLEGADADRAMGDLDALITGIRDRGFRFVSADELAREASQERPGSVTISK